MNGDGVDLAAFAADEALIARVRAANAPGQLGNELERLLMGWRGVCPTHRTPGQRRRHDRCHVAT
jgi:hypothetical protein